MNYCFKSYLENRKQFDCLSSVKSDMLHISCVVPQGSVFGPILFLLYIYKRLSQLLENIGFSFAFNYLNVNIK